METQIIKDFYGRIIGRIETKPNGDKLVTDFGGKILGRYRADLNITTDFNGRKVADGDACMIFLHL